MEPRIRSGDSWEELSIARSIHAHTAMSHSPAGIGSWSTRPHLYYTKRRSHHPTPWNKGLQDADGSANELATRDGRRYNDRKQLIFPPFLRAAVRGGLSGRSADSPSFACFFQEKSNHGPPRFSGLHGRFS